MKFDAIISIKLYITTSLSNDLDNVRTDLESYVTNKFETVNPLNWYNGDAVTLGYKISADGTITADESKCYTDYIPVSEGDLVDIYKGTNFTKLYRSNICLYDSNKAVVSGGSNSSSSQSFEIPSGVSYVRISMGTTNASAIVKCMIVLDEVEPTAYSAYFTPYERLTEDFLTEETEEVLAPFVNGTVGLDSLINRYACAVPRARARITRELQQPWYIASMVSPKTTPFSVTLASNTRDSKKMNITGTSTGTYSNGFKFKMYDELFGKILRSDVDYASNGYGLPRTFIAENLSDCTLLAIGDSTVDHDTMTATLLSHFEQQGHTITLIGTRGDGSETNKNEGRAGWKATDYLSDRQYDGVTNPFYNPTSETFDFDYYMTNQGYTAPDFVVIQLGINDLYNLAFADIPTGITTAWDAVKTMIDSILEYNSNIKIILNLPTTPNSDISEHSNFLPLYENSIIKYNDYVQDAVLLTYSATNVRCSYCHLILDADSEIRDGVHPTANGYAKMALEIINQINCWQNGVS